jgi:hypothetical protein
MELRGQELAASGDRLLLLVDECIEMLVRQSEPPAGDATPRDGRTLG